MVKTLLGLREERRNDAADALALAITHLTPARPERPLARADLIASFFYPCKSRPLLQPRSQLRQPSLEPLCRNFERPQHRLRFRIAAHLV
jgi:hypothetical protein